MRLVHDHPHGDVVVLLADDLGTYRLPGGNDGYDLSEMRANDEISEERLDIPTAPARRATWARNLERATVGGQPGTEGSAVLMRVPVPVFRKREDDVRRHGCDGLEDPSAVPSRGKYALSDRTSSKR